MTPEPTPAATYRLQFNRDFRFEDARAIVPYLSRLGVTHLYSSPVLRARNDSTHGYDVVDPRTINPAIGDGTQFRDLVETLKAHGMGLVLDVVPNHMATGHENRYWLDVLTYGPGSHYARWFDIDWRMPDAKSWGRVLVPILGAPLPKIIARDELRLAWEDGRFTVRYWDHRFPLDPATVPAVCRFGLDRLRERVEPDHPALREIRSILKDLARLPRRTTRMRRRVEIPVEATEARLSQLTRVIEGSPVLHNWAVEVAADFGGDDEGRRRLRRLLDAQCYRLVYWRQAARGINYRRFFDINDLISIRQEDPQVFEETHALVARWIHEGVVHGLRIDHIDGLRNPREYLVRLRELVQERLPTTAHFPIFVEKILAPDETLPDDWPVDGTTGYDFLNQVESIFVAPDGFDEIVEMYQRLVGRPVTFQDAMRWGKRRILRHDLSAFVGRLAELLLRLARNDPQHSSLTFQQLVRAIVEVVVALPVYRTYLNVQQARLAPDDRQRLEPAIEQARGSGRTTSAALDFLRDVLVLRGLPELPEQEQRERLNFIERFQQLTGPATAKGVEDTALYAWVALVSRNDVGGEPDHSLANALGNLHAAALRRAESSPREMLAVTTHDTKRTADVRARLDVLSELPRLWSGHIERWRRMNRPHRRRAAKGIAPDAAAEYLFYQTLIGIWPAADPQRLEQQFPDRDTLIALRGRLEDYMLKAVREAKTRTSWVRGNEHYEQSLTGFIRSTLLTEGEPASGFLREVHALASRIARPGFWNSLARSVIHVASPGTPDFYQGDELWNLALVDPDNRRPVDFKHRRQLLDALLTELESGADSRRALLRELVERPEDGRIKLHVIRAGLIARLEHRELFASGGYDPLAAEGSAAAHVFAFARTAGDVAAVAVVPRLPATLVPEPANATLGELVWGDTVLPLPEPLRGWCWTSAFTREPLDVESDAATSNALPLARIFDVFPVQLLIGRRTRPEGLT